jgi:hypothetical protein
MVWDLGKAMRKKEEFESARLLDFEFRQRVRTARLLARSLGLDESLLVGETLLKNEDAIIELAAERSAQSVDDVQAKFSNCSSRARRELIEERGDPTPYRLG